MITDKILFSSVKQGVLNEFDELVAAGLSSRASRIVNATVAAWNRVYGIEGSVIIPARTAKAIRKLQAIDVDILVASELPPADENVSIACLCQNQTVLDLTHYRMNPLLTDICRRPIHHLW